MTKVNFDNELTNHTNGLLDSYVESEAFDAVANCVMIDSKKTPTDVYRAAIKKARERTDRGVDLPTVHETHSMSLAERLELVLHHKARSMEHFTRENAKDPLERMFGDDHGLGRMLELLGASVEVVGGPRQLSEDDIVEMHDKVAKLDRGVILREIDKGGVFMDGFALAYVGLTVADLDAANAWFAKLADSMGRNDAHHWLHMCMFMVSKDLESLIDKLAVSNALLTPPLWEPGGCLKAYRQLEYAHEQVCGK